MILPSRDLMPVIQAALERGQLVRMTANGSSMLPFIRDNDVVELEPIRSALATGDIVLAQPTAGFYVLHRIVRLEGDSLWVRGDAQSNREGPLLPQAVLGRAVTTCHNGRLHSLDRGWLRLAGLVWVWTSPLGFFMLRLALPVYQLGRRGQRWLRRIWKQD